MNWVWRRSIEIWREMITMPTPCVAPYQRVFRRRGLVRTCDLISLRGPEHIMWFHLIYLFQLYLNEFPIFASCVPSNLHMRIREWHPFDFYKHCLNVSVILLCYMILEKISTLKFFLNNQLSFFTTKYTNHSHKIFLPLFPSPKGSYIGTF